MSCGDLRHALLALAVGLSACGVRLDELPEPAEPKKTLPLAAGCALFGESGSSIDGVFDRARSIRLPGEPEPAWLVTRVSAQGSETENAVLRGTPSGDACSIAAAKVDPILDDKAEMLDAVTDESGNEAWLYFKDETQGYGVASWDAGAGRFVPGDALWTSDRPNFGSAALQSEGIVFAYGCLDARFLDADCWLAQAPLANIDQGAAYTYYRGGGNVTSQLDSAAVLFSGGPVGSVVWHGARARFIAAYVPPLGSSLVLRAGLRPDGPWSGAFETARCELPEHDPEAFCLRAVLHPQLAGSDRDHIVVSYAIGSFNSAARNEKPQAYRTRVARIALPENLP